MKNTIKRPSQERISISDGNRTLELTVDGYEFHDLPEGSDTYDFNWLNVWIAGKEGDTTIIEKIEPCVLTWELKRIYDIVDKLLSNELDEADSDNMFLLTESNIYFTIKRYATDACSVDITAGGFNVKTRIFNEDLIQIRKLLAAGIRRFPELS